MQLGHNNNKQGTMNKKVKLVLAVIATIVVIAIIATVVEVMTVDSRLKQPLNTGVIKK